ncbi:LIM domain family protein [Brugia pahangi]
MLYFPLLILLKYNLAEMENTVLRNGNICQGVFNITVIIKICLRLTTLNMNSSVVEFALVDTTMAQAEMVTVRMSRGQMNTPWGFDIGPELTIINIIGGSLADRAGLLNGDVLVELEGHQNLNIELAKQLLSKTEHRVELVVHRTGGNITHRIWQPSVTENTEYNKFQHSVFSVASTDTEKMGPPIVPLKVSLEHQNPESIAIPGFNVAAQPFGDHQEVKHLQYNSPMPLYSPQTAAEQYLQQTGGLFGTDPNLTKQKEVPSYLRSETLRLIQECERSKENGEQMIPVRPIKAGYETTRPKLKNISEVPMCFICGRNIKGVMCRAFDRTLHSDCFQCSTCGSSLKNQGHHFINDKFYCDIHGHQLRGGGGVARHNEIHWERSKMVPASDKNTLLTPYHPEITTGQSISISPISPTPWKTQSPISPNSRGVPPAATQYGHELNELRKEIYSSSMSSVNRDSYNKPSNIHEPQIELAKSRDILHAQSNRVSCCEDCKQEIRDAYVLANGLAYCPDHFICSNKLCGRKLLDIGFVEEKGHKYCERCFETEIAPRCAKCNQPIIADCLNALQKQWHPHCFACTYCHNPFGNSAFFLEQGQPYCETDWNTLFTTKCVSCHYPIEAGDRWLEALGVAFHSTCFNCTSCNVNLEGESFYAKNGAPYCKLHA